MASLDKIKKFEQQVQSSLEGSIDNLRVQDRMNEQQINSLQKKIQSTLLQKKYTNDLIISKSELKEIYNTLHQKDDGLLKQNRISDFDDFTELLGIFNADSVSYTPTLQQTFVLGKNIKIEDPKSALKSINMKKILTSLRARSDLAPYLRDNHPFQANGGARLDFSIEKDGINIKYRATAEGILRVEHESNPNADKKWLNLKKELQILHDKFKHDPLISASDKKAVHEEKITIKSLPSGNGLLKHYLEENKRIRQLLKNLGPLAHNTLLIDDRNGQKYIERNTEYRGNFSLYLLNQKGERVTKINYEGNLKVAENKFFLGTNTFEHITAFDGNGVKSFSLILDKNGHEVSRDTYGENGVLFSRKTNSGTDFFDDTGKSSVYTVTTAKDKGGKEKMYMKGTNNVPFSTYNELQKQNPKATVDQYLNMLAKELNTDAKLNIFFELFMQYVHDSADPKNPLAKGTEKKNGDYWQLPTETSTRLENGKMLGDCDDYAFLAREILRRQGKNAFVVSIPEHAVCVWLEKRADGKWNANSLCTFGLDKNGNRFGMKQDPKKAQGYINVKDAINSVMEKYDTVGKGTEHPINYRIAHNQVAILEIPKQGKKLVIEDFPITALTNKNEANKLIQDAKSSSKSDEIVVSLKNIYQMRQQNPTSKN